ncbi:lysine 5,6-aminomutase reactivase subunit KamB [Salinithrix halophila]|uniref:Selenium-dependent hydroxylase accessory protein YqeC n=1 Tax=Salinithrix halophila TaxID=1485204 RepID=A0ABV8JKK1_9BACL
MLRRLVIGGGSLAVIGLAKNAGKTTVLNALAWEAARSGTSIGLASVGVDGEERDVWSGREKPPVFVPSGGLAATAAPLLEDRPGDWEITAITSFHSSLGPIAIARALRETKVKLAGIITAEQIRETETLFLEQGVRLMLVDGAYDRKAAASPWVTHGAICVAGAVMGRTLGEVVHRTEEAVRVLTLPGAEDPVLIRAGETARATGCLVGVRGGRVEELPFPSLLSRPDRLREHLSSGGWSGLAFPGALTDRALEHLSESGLPLVLCLRDPTRCFASLRSLRRFTRAGGQIFCLRALSLKAVAVNPVSPDGWSFDPEEMKERIREVCGSVPVLDVRREADPRPLSE